MAEGSGRVYLPPDFAALLARVLAPGEAGEAGDVLKEALTLDDLRLAYFLEAVAARLEQPEQPIMARELRALLDAVPEV